jgi:hypothetical protein
VPRILELLRDLRVLQTFLLAVLLLLIWRYGLDAGRNLRALLVGYTTYLGFSMITLTLRYQWGRDFQQIWAVVYPLGYLFTLFIWCAGMWVYSPGSAPSLVLENDYERMAAETSRSLVRIRYHLRQPWRE